MHARLCAERRLINLLYSLQVLAKRHIDMVTAQAWLLKSEELEEKVCLLCMLVGIEFLFEEETEKVKMENTRRPVYIKISISNNVTLVSCTDVLY